ncbi:MAG TPA: 2-amino-4-hydroxy-6-hydroxymethyldihydropteridine diphosphokinase [Xanthomonadales bacterium]|nr:2-amino-4-hydroxy-6-hydroxymethyldihydropteridine diphosphokinase [Xanthomonadales bacterium]
MRQALAKLAEDPAIEVMRVSSLYRSAAWGRTEQPDFTNAVAELATTLSAPSLLNQLLQLEADLGRNRDTGHWGPRLLDLDLLTFADEIICTPELNVPHPRMHQRAFVLVPLLELEPEFEIPGLGSAGDCLDRLEFQQIAKIP